MAVTSIIFVHGSNHGAWCWELLRPLLSAPFASLDLPGRGHFARDPAEVNLADWVDHVCNAITGPDLRNVVLVGHSLAGITLPRVVDRLPERIEHVVYVAAAVPPEGESICSWLLGDREVDDVIPPPDDESVANMFCNDMDARQTRYVQDHLCAEAGRPFTEPMDLAGLSHPVPRTYVKLLRDRAPISGYEDDVIARLDPVEVVELDAGHDVMISRPDALAPILNRLTRRG